MATTAGLERLALKDSKWNPSISQHSQMNLMKR
jgi:hypothetical protein